MWKSSHRIVIFGFVGFAACTSPADDGGGQLVSAATNAAADLDQCANGPLNSPVPCTGSAWQNGNLNENQAHYAEGQSVPYRLRFSDVDTAVTHTVRIEWDTTAMQAALVHHAEDYLTTHNRTETSADPCSGVAGCVLAGASTYTIPTDPWVANGPDGVSGNADDITQVPGVFTLYGGTITGVSSYTLDGSLDGTSKTSIVITFTASTTTPVLAWGGHISLRHEWAPELAATHFPGSPYHMRLLDLDGAGGNQDRSLSATAVYDLPTLIVIKHVVNSYGGTAVASDFTMTVTATNPSSASFPGAESPGTQITVDPGSYSVGESGPGGYEAGYSADCTGTVTYDGVKTCTVTNSDSDQCVGVVCGAPPGDCYEAGVCNSSTGQCTYAPKSAGTACGDPSDTVCDDPNTCDGAGACQPNYEPAIVLCRTDAGDCDVPEYCDGAGSCPSNSFEATGTACGNPADTICDNPDSCDASGACVPNVESTAVLCRADAGACDVPEYCDGAGSCPANGFEIGGTACGDPSDTICDNPDTCDWSGACQPNIEPLTTLCRSDSGECDVAEYCDAAGACPANGYESPGTSCGNPSDSICDNPDTCDAGGACTPNYEPTTVLCREDSGECDVPEYCDAVGACPSNGFEPPGTACGNPADSICDNPDTCSASGTCTPNYEPTTVLCREDAGECDVPEYCDAGGACPSNGFEPQGTACGNPADTICDNPDSCGASGTCTPNFEPTTVLCREDAGECDVPEYCDAGGACPANGFEAPGTACGNPADSICDNPDTCVAGGTCSPNFEPTTVLCREDAGECDVPEYCDAGGACPSNGFEAQGTACGDPSDTVCDNPDTCTSAGECVVNVEAAGTLCRALAGDCDVAEVCDGIGGCPSDAFVAAGTLCRASSDQCDPVEECSGLAAACPSDVAATCTMCGFKFYDANVNGAFDADELGIEGWKFLAGTGAAYSDAGGSFEFTGLAEGDYTLCETASTVGIWHQTAPATVCYSVHVPSAEATACTLDFGNVCLGAGGGKTIGFWTNRIGQIAFQGADNGAASLAMLTALNLRNLDGSNFDPTRYSSVKSWLKNADATNMAYMLSAQLAAMSLDVAKGYVDPSRIVYAPGTASANPLGFATLSALLAEANTELGVHGVVLAGSQYRSYQEALKTALDKANNNLSFLQPEACSLSFTPQVKTNGATVTASSMAAGE